MERETDKERDKRRNSTSLASPPPRALQSRYASTKPSSSGSEHSRAGVSRKTTDYVGLIQKSPKNGGSLRQTDKPGNRPSSNSVSNLLIDRDDLTAKKKTRIRIKTFHRTYVCAQPDKTLVEHSVNKLEEEYIWTRFEISDGISLKSCYNRFLSAEKGGKLLTNRARKQTETFTVEVIPNAEKKFAIKTSAGEYLCALPDGSLQCNRFGPQAWEIFEIEEEPFAPPVYGGNLNDIIVYQLKNGLYSKVPHVLEVLAEIITKYDGHRTEGIWRISGDGSAVIKLRSEIQKGNYDCHIDNCHDAATLFKLFLRELVEPVFPENYYSTALRLAEELNIKAIHELMKNKFDNINVEVIKFVINFLRSFLKPEYVKLTMMNSNNLATVFAPTLLRCPSDNPLMQITASSSETKFVLILLENFPDEYKEEYLPTTTKK